MDGRDADRWPRCIGSYHIDGEQVTVDLPEVSRWYRMHKKHFKLYDDAGPDAAAAMGEKTLADLDEIPAGAKKATVRPSHGAYSSQYNVSWEF